MPRVGRVLIDSRFLTDDARKNLVNEWLARIKFLTHEVVEHEDWLEFIGYSPYFIDYDAKKGIPRYKLIARFSSGELIDVSVDLVLKPDPTKPQNLITLDGYI